MFDKKSIQIFLSYVPDLKYPGKVFFTVIYIILLGCLCAGFFFFLDRLAWYAPIISQTIMAIIVVAISYIHFKLVPTYREKYGLLAYRYYFFHLMLPYLVTWYACFFHPIFVSGPLLLPWWLAIGVGIFLLLLMLLTNIQIERAGFQVITHGLDLYTVFQESTAVVYGEIYGYIRHPLYFSLTCGCLGLAFLSNNGVAIIVATLQLIPALAVGYMEDVELINRVGEDHRQYIRQTAAIIPYRKLGGFIKLLFSFQ